MDKPPRIGELYTLRVLQKTPEKVYCSWMVDRNNDTRLWWVIRGAAWAAGSPPWLAAAPNGYRAVAVVRGALVAQERERGETVRNARARVAEQHLTVIGGPLDTEQACRLETGWALATAAAATSGAVAEAPIMHDDPVPGLDDQRRERIIREVAHRYRAASDH